MTRLNAVLLSSPASLVLAMLVSACSSKMDAKDCVKVKESAFELINTANVCSTDADCKPSTWPGCAKPISAANGEKLRVSMESFQKGRCEEPKLDCKPAPAVYCQEGICAFRYKPAELPGGGMKIE